MAHAPAMAPKRSGKQRKSDDFDSDEEDASEEESDSPSADEAEEGSESGGEEEEEEEEEEEREPAPKRKKAEPQQQQQTGDAPPARGAGGRGRGRGRVGRPPGRGRGRGRGAEAPQEEVDRAAAAAAVPDDAPPPAVGGQPPRGAPHVLSGVPLLAGPGGGVPPGARVLQGKVVGKAPGAMAGGGAPRDPVPPVFTAPELDELEPPAPAGGEVDESESADDFDPAAYEAQEQSLRRSEAQRMRHILAAFTPEQLERYECFRRSFLNRKQVRKVVAATAGHTPKEAALVVIAGLAKTFVGELVEEGKRVQAEKGEAGPLRPVHVREAHRRLFARGRVFSSAARPSPLGVRGAAARCRL